jgi:hypothetical protein
MSYALCMMPLLRAGLVPIPVPIAPFSSKIQKSIFSEIRPNPIGTWI